MLTGRLCASERLTLLAAAEGVDVQCVQCVRLQVVQGVTCAARWQTLLLTAPPAGLHVHQAVACDLRTRGLPVCREPVGGHIGEDEAAGRVECCARDEDQRTLTQLGVNILMIKTALKI